MVKLYYTSSSCGAASFISAHIAGIKIETEQVDIKTHKTTSGADFYGINPKGNVPTLVLDDGSILNENAATLQWVADQKPGTVAPAAGTPARYRVIEALSYIGTEVHPSIGGLFNPTLAPDVKTFILGRADQKLKYLDNNLLKGKKYLVGDSLSIADIYLYIVLSWTKYVGIDLAPYKNVAAYFQNISELEQIKAAHARIATNPSTTI